MSVGTLVGAITQWGGNAVRSLLRKPERHEPSEKILDKVLADRETEQISAAHSEVHQGKHEE